MSVSTIYTIYKITNIVNNKIYIGYTQKSPIKRFEGHIREAKLGKSKKYFHRAIRKYKEENFILESIYSTYDLEHVKNLEKHFIREYNSYCVSGFGYNMTFGGDGSNGSKRTPEQIKAQSERMKGVRLDIPQSEEHKRKRAESQRGGKRTAEQRKRMSDARKNYIPTEEHKRNGANSRLKLFEITYPDGKVVQVKPLSEWCKENNVSIGGMYRVANNFKKSHKGYVVRKV